MKRVIVALTDAEARGLALALGNSLYTESDGRDICGGRYASAMSGYGKLQEAIRGSLPDGAARLTDGEAKITSEMLGAALAGPLDGYDDDSAEHTRAVAAVERARAKLPVSAFVVVKVG